MGKHEINISGLNNEEEQKNENMVNKAIEEILNEIITTNIEDDEEYDDYYYRSQRGEIKYNKERSTIESRGNETKIEEISENGIIRIEGLDFDIPINEGIRLLNFKNWIKYMKETERKEDNPNIIYSGMTKTKKRRMHSNTFYNYDGTHIRLLDGSTVEKHCPTTSKDETKMKSIAKWLNNKEITNNEKEQTITSITNEAIRNVFKEIMKTPIEETKTLIIPIMVGKGVAAMPINQHYRDKDTEKDYRSQRGEIKYNKEKSTIESRGNETKIEKISENGIIRIEGLDFDIPINEGIRLLNFKNWIKYMKETERKEDNPNIIYSGMTKTKKRRMHNNTFYNHDGTHIRLLDGETIEKYCPTISQDETAMKKIAERLNE